MKVKKSFLLWGLSILIVVIAFVVIAWISLWTTDSTKLTQINVVTQLIYTFVTTLMVIMTYAVLKATQEQKFQAVRPYLVANNFGIWKNAAEHNREELDFDIYNEGPGLALSINIKVKKTENKKLLFESNFTRCTVQDNKIYGALCAIRDEINHIRNNQENGSARYGYSPYVAEHIPIEFPIEGDIKEYLIFIVELEYSDIYGKKYKNTFDVKLNEEELEEIECVEKFLEV